MLTLPDEPLPLIVEFAPLFSKPVWERAKTVLVGAILAVGKRTVTACLRVTVNSGERTSLVVFDAAGRDPLGRLCLGPAVSYGFVPIFTTSAAKDTT